MTRSAHCRYVNWSSSATLYACRSATSGWSTMRRTTSAALRAAQREMMPSPSSGMINLTATVQDPLDDRPLPRQHVARSVDPGVADRRTPVAGAPGRAPPARPSGSARRTSAPAGRCRPVDRPPERASASRRAVRPGGRRILGRPAHRRSATSWPHRPSNTSAMARTRPYIARTTSNDRSFVASSRVSGKWGSAWRCGTSGRPGGSCTPRWSSVTSKSRSSSPVRMCGPVGPVPPMTSASIDLLLASRSADRHRGLAAIGDGGPQVPVRDGVTRGDDGRDAAGERRFEGPVPSSAV